MRAVRHPKVTWLDDGKSCHVCGCTEHNACVITDSDGPRLKKFTCAWSTKSTPARPLCTACE